MSQQNEGGLKGFTATEALEAYRRVKLTSGSGTAVEYSDAGQAFIGVTQASCAIGEIVTVALRSACRTYKTTAAGVVVVGATIYGANDGKVDDASSGTAIGTALEAAGANGDIIEALLDNGAAGAISGDSTAINDLETDGGVPIVFGKAGITDAYAANVIIATLASKVRVLRWWVISRDTTASNISLCNGTTNVIGVIAKGTADNTMVPSGTQIDTYQDVEALGTLQAKGSGSAAAFDVYVECVKIA